MTSLDVKHTSTEIHAASYLEPKIAHFSSFNYKRPISVSENSPSQIDLRSTQIALGQPRSQHICVFKCAINTYYI